MKKTFKALKFSTVFILFLVSFIACDKDFSVIESDVLGVENANFYTDSLVLPILAYNKKLDAVQINNLPSNLLGVFNDPDYGKTSASIVSQLTPTTFDPDFGTDPAIDSVVVNIPYFSTVISVDSDGKSTYKLDSLYGNSGAEFKLTIYQNNYFLRDFDPSGEINSTQNYYSNASNTVNSVLNGSTTINFDDHLGELIYEKDDFKTNAEAIELWTVSSTDTVKTFVAPRLRISFNDPIVHANEIAFWETTILEKQDDAVLSNANNFKNYFRGLYLKTEEAVIDDGSMILVDLASSAANITIYYTSGESSSRTQSNYVMNFTGNRLNTFINDFEDMLIDGDKENGDETLNLKGLEGSMAVVDLFPTDAAVEDFKDMFRDADGNQKRLINEAHLVITDTHGLDDFHTYDRIYAYDVKNNITTVDYQIDPTENNEAFNSKIFNLGQREEDTGKYKIRLTEHLNNIIQNDSTNYKIGLVLSNNVNVTSNLRILNSNDDVTALPAASIISPRGTILNGSIAIAEDKRLILKVFFTELK